MVPWKKSPDEKSSRKKVTWKKIPTKKDLRKKGPRKSFFRERNARKFERLFVEIMIIMIYLPPSFDRGFIIYRRKETGRQVVKIKIRGLSVFFFCDAPLLSTDSSKKAFNAWFWFFCFCGANLASRAHSLVKTFFFILFIKLKI